MEYYERNKQIDYWADTKIKPGANWKEEVEQALASAKVAVLLISIDYLTSQFIIENELPPLLAAAQAKGVSILPVILRPCKLDKNLSQFQAVNSPSMPLARMKGYQREELWVKVTDAIRDAMDFQQAEIAPANKHQFMETANATSTKYNEMLEELRSLSSLIQRLLLVLESLEMSGWENKVQQLKERVLADTFKVLVMGEFKRGKTTLINAMLGLEVLPSNVTPIAATIVEVKWGKAPKAVVHFRTSKDNPTRKVQEV